jgi:hypothetical protein
LSATRVATLEPDDRLDGVSWRQGDEIFLTRWRKADSTATIWRVPAAGGALSLVATLPAACNLASTAIGDAGRKAVCLVQQYRSDIWTVEGIGR